MLDPLDPAAAGQVDGWLARADSPQTQPFEVRLRSPDPDDLTLREARALGSADVIAHEPGVPAAVLLRARADAVRREVAAGEAAPVAAGLVVVLRYS